MGASRCASASKKRLEIALKNCADDGALLYLGPRSPTHALALEFQGLTQRFRHSDTDDGVVFHGHHLYANLALYDKHYPFGRVFSES